MTWLRVGDGGCRGGGFTVGGRTGGGCIGGGCEAKGMGKGSTGAVAGMVEGDGIGKGSSGAVAGAIVGKGTGKGSTGAATSGARSSAEAMFTSEGRYGSPLEENEWPAVGGVSSGAAGLGAAELEVAASDKDRASGGPLAAGAATACDTDSPTAVLAAATAAAAAAAAVTAAAAASCGLVAGAMPLHRTLSGSAQIEVLGKKVLGTTILARLCASFPE